MSPSAGLAHLGRLAPSHIKMGLGRVQTALTALGNPQLQFPAIHVAGTNGKGSTCAIAASCLSQRYRTGLYTSPHLVRANERIRINGADIDDATFGRRIDEVISVVGEHHELTYFEFVTVVAFWHFAQEHIDIAVVETGLGGRLDATTACRAAVTCITPIDFDHMEYLGPTLGKIAGEKAGIFKPGVPAISSRQRPEVLEVLLAHQPGLWLEGREFEVANRAYRGPRWNVNALELSLHGAHQQQNLSCALACLEALPDFPLTPGELESGVRQATWPGRFEVFSGQPTHILDGAHNPAGVETLLRALETQCAGKAVHLVFGVFADKDTEPMMRALFPKVSAVYATALPGPRSKDPQSYETLGRALNAHFSTYGDALAALEAARQNTPAEGVVLVAGSLSLIGLLRPTVVNSP